MTTVMFDLKRKGRFVEMKRVYLFAVGVVLAAAFTSGYVYAQRVQACGCGGRDTGTYVSCSGNVCVTKCLDGGKVYCETVEV